MQTPTDEELLGDFVAGRSAGFELLVRRHINELYQFVLRFVSDSVSAEDIVQETLLQVHASAESFDPSRRFKPWLFAIAANKARDFMRRRKRRRELPFEAKIDEEADSAQRFVDLLSADVEAVDEDAVFEERRRAVREAVDSLPDKLRLVLILAYYHQMPYKDVADVLEIPVGTVKSRLHAAVRAFRGAYESVLGGSRESEQ